jgi:hypothetical protein
MNQDLTNEIIKHLSSLTHVSKENDQASENFLMKDALVNPNYVQTLMSLCMDQSQTEEIRLKSVLILKRVLGFKRDELQGNQEEFFRSNCLQCLTLCDNMKIGKNFAEVIYKTILKFYPSYWPGLDQQMNEMFQSVQSVEKLFWVLTGYYNLSKVREHTVDKEEILLKNNSVTAVFPKMEEFLVGVLTNEMSKQSAMILQLIAKIFCKNVRYNLPVYLMNQEKNQLWMETIIKVFQLPHENSPFCEEILSAKKWFSASLVSYFRKYSQLNSMNKEEIEKQFAIHYSQHFCLPIINILIQELRKFNRNVYVKKEDKFALNIMRVFLQAEKNKLLTQSIGNIFLELAKDVVLPSLKFNERDKETYEDDPDEYFKRNDDFLTSLTYREGALSFLSVTFDNSPDYFQNLFTSTLSNPDLDPATKEVFYHVFEKMYETYRAEDQYANFVFWVFKNCLSVDLQLPFGFLQMRCCRVIYRYISHTVPVEALENIYKSICGLMEHKDLPVRCCAALAFNSLLSKQEMTNLVRPHLKDILVIFVKLIKNIENDTLINSLKNIFTKFKNDLQPFVKDLSATIVNICINMYRKNQERDNNDVEVDEFAFVSGLTSIDYLIEITNQPDILASIMDSLFPLAELILKDFGLESFEECIGIVSSLCAKMKQNLHPKILQIFEYLLYGMGNIELVQQKMDQGIIPQNPLLLDIVNKSSDCFIEFTSCISTFFRNVIYHNWMYICNQKDQLGNNYLELLYSGINHALEFKMELTDNTNKVCLSMLFSTLVMTAKKFTPEMLATSTLLSHSIEIVLKMIKETEGETEEESSFKVFQNCLLHNIGVCLIANPEITINYLESKNLLNLIMVNLAEKINDLMTYRTLRTFFMGLCFLIQHRIFVKSPDFKAFLENPEVLIFMNRVAIKLCILKQLNKIEEEEPIDEFDDHIPDLDSEISKLLGKFQQDPALENMENELCRTDMNYILNVEVLMAFDFDICNEYIDEIDEFKIFKDLLEKESAERSSLFQGYISGTTEAMQKNVQQIFS